MLPQRTHSDMGFPWIRLVKCLYNSAQVISITKTLQAYIFFYFFNINVLFSIRQRTVPREAASGALLFDHPIENDPNNTYKLVEVRHQDIQEAPEVTQNIQNTAELGVRMMAARDYEKPVRSQTLDILKGTPQCACAVEESAGVSTVAVEEGHYSVDNWHPEDVYRTRSEIYPASFASVGPSRRQRPCPKAQEQHKSSVPNLSVSTELHYFTWRQQT